MNAIKKWPNQRPAIALLITLFFVITVTATVGVSIIQLRLSAKQLREGKCLIQSSMILDDLLNLLKTSPLLDQVQNAETFHNFLYHASIIPLSLENLNVKINISSSMGRFNINALSSSKPFKEALSGYMLQYNVGDIDYLQDLLTDAMSGQQTEYKTAIFDDMPWLYREKIASMTHLEQILDYYILTRHDNSIKNIPWKQLVRFSKHGDTKIDVNYVTPQLWKLLLPELSDGTAADLSSSLVIYKKSEDLSLSTEDITRLQKFNISYYVPRTQIEVAIKRNDQNVRTTFEYDLKLKKGGNFDYGL